MGKLAYFCTALSAFICSACTQAENNPQSTANNLIIFYEPANKAQLLAEIKRYPADILYDYQRLNGIAIHLTTNQSLTKAIQHFEKIEGVLKVNQDHMLQIQ